LNKSPANLARLRAWFLRNLLETAERELGAGAVASLPERAPSRLRPHLSLDRLRATAALDTLPLDDGEEAILLFEQVLGDGSGKTLERVACEMLARQLVQAASAVRVGDLFGTVARLRAPLEHPFVDVTVVFDLNRSPTGFRLSVGIPGRPRATRVLGHLATGAVQAAERFARESHSEPLRLELTTFADRASIDARFRRTSTLPPAPDHMPSSRRASPSRLIPRLSDEVARILDSTRVPAAQDSDVPPRRGRSTIPPPRSTIPPPAAPPTEPSSSRPPDSSPPSRRPSRPPPAR
jgi:hypothetical protein